MKKFLPLAFALCLSFAANSQTFYTADFGTGLGAWTAVDNTGNNAGNWTYSHNPISGFYSGATFRFYSATASNGFMFFMSDSTVDDGKAENADLKSPAIDCSGKSYVFLEFDEEFATNGTATGTVFVSTDGTNWNQVYITTQNSETNPAHTIVDITTYAANQATVYLKFNWQGNWDYFWALDDIKLVVPPANDVSIDNINISDYLSPGSYTVSGTLTNHGGTTLQGLDISYTINGGAAVSQTLNGLGIVPLSSGNFSFTTQASLTNYQSYNIAVTGASPNGGVDAVPSNNSTSKKVIILSQRPDKNVMIEEFTTAQCQYCPMGGTKVEDILSAHTYAVSASIHAGFGTDAMTTNDMEEIADTLDENGAPAIMVDRVYWDDEEAIAMNTGWTLTNWDDKTVARKAALVPVTIKGSNTYNTQTRELSVSATAKFYSAISNSDYRINCYIIEDSVTGTGSGYNQINYYHNHTNQPYNVWYGAGNPIIGYNHRHVARYMFGGAWGTTGVIPSTTANLGEYTKQYTYTLPGNWDASQIKLLVLVQNYNPGNVNDRNILNVIEMPLNGADSISATPVNAVEEVKGQSVASVTLYPNPASDIVSLDYDLTDNADLSFEVHNMLGQTVHSTQQESLGSGAYTTRINTSNFQNGVYFVAVKENNKIVQTLRFVINR